MSMSLLVMFDEILDLKVSCYVLRVRPSFEGGTGTPATVPPHQISSSPNDFRLFEFPFCFNKLDN